MKEHRTGIAEITGSNPDFYRLLLSNCLNRKIYCDDHSSLSYTDNVVCTTMLRLLAMIPNPFSFCHVLGLLMLYLILILTNNNTAKNQCEMQDL